MCDGSAIPGVLVAAKSVIFIDDDPSIKCLASRAGKRLGCEFLFFERALDVFASIDWINPNLIVLDLSMTDLEGDHDAHAGIRITEEIRRQFGGRFPILILTGSETPKLILDCLRGGADDYYAKSHDLTGLIKRIAAWLVVDYSRTDAKQERETAANALETLVSQKGLLTVREWRNVAMVEISQNEGTGMPVGGRNSTSDLLAWRKTA